MIDLTRKPTFEKGSENIYKNLGFTRNPFPINPSVKFNSNDSRENGSIFYKELREREINSFKLIVNSSNSINLLMDYAAYRGRGNGKTAFLNYQRKVVNEDLGSNISEDKKVLYLVYVAPSGEKKERKFWQIARLFYSAIIDQDLLLIAFCRLRALYGMIPTNILGLESEKGIAKTIGDDSWLTAKLKESNSGIDVRDSNKMISLKLTERGCKIDLRHKDLYKNTFDYFQEQICNDFSDFNWRVNGNNIVFDELVKVFKVAEFSNVFLLFDEAEKIITAQNTNERREFVDSLRYYFIDGNVENTSNSFYKLLMTIHPYSQELLMPHWKSAGLERFAELGTQQANDNTLFFHPIEQEEVALPLAQAYIEESRVENYNGNKYSPFEEDALRHAFLKSDKIPGKYLRLLFKLIEKAANEKLKSITKKEIESVINKDRDYSNTAEEIKITKLDEPKNRLDSE